MRWPRLEPFEVVNIIPAMQADLNLLGPADQLAFMSCRDNHRLTCLEQRFQRGKLEFYP